MDEEAPRGPADPGSADAGPGRAGDDEVARLAARVDRLERQLAVMVKRFSERLTDHERRLDRLDEPPERAWLKR